jgi:hypothetical protein
MSNGNCQDCDKYIKIEDEQIVKIFGEDIIKTLGLNIPKKESKENIEVCQMLCINNFADFVFIQNKPPQFENSLGDKIYGLFKTCFELVVKQ